MDQVMAVEHVDSVPRRVSCDDSHFFVRAYPDDVFQSNCFVRLNPAAATCSRDDLEINQVDVNWVSPASALVDQLPNLDRSTFGLCKNSGIDTIRPNMSVNVPYATVVLEDHLVVDSGLFGRVWDCP
jgi:hypothetical protein